MLDQRSRSLHLFISSESIEVEQFLSRRLFDLFSRRGFERWMVLRLISLSSPSIRTAAKIEY